MSMFESVKGRLPWVFVGLVLISAAVLFTGAPQVMASDDHDKARLLREGGQIMPLAEILQHPELQGKRVIEAELEREHGRLVYELELLDIDGRVRERYFDAATGEPLGGDKSDDWKR
jgi:uncharacterized membrane protein YkoI